MQRGVVIFTNSELKILHELAISQGCQKEDLIAKISPIGVEGSDKAGPDQNHNVLISEDEAEVMLDCMPMPDKDDDPNLVNARIKIQQFLAKSRFPESSS